MNIEKNVDTLFNSLNWLVEKARERDEQGNWKYALSDRNEHFPMVLYAGSLLDITVVEAEKPKAVVPQKPKEPTKSEIIEKELLESLGTDQIGAAVITELQNNSADHGRVNDVSKPKRFT